ncbi:MAG: hypothetical protein ACR2G4_12520 [Pyrinomonadaceae bacterium]
MRWKLLILTSLVAALISAGGSFALGYWMHGLTKSLSAPATFLAGGFIIPLIAITLAGIFIYRHTSRRRKLQAAATVLLSLTLTVAALLIAQMFLNLRSAGVSRLTSTLPRAADY